MRLPAMLARRPLLDALAAVSLAASLPAVAYDAMPSATAAPVSALGYSLAPMPREEVLRRAQGLTPFQRSVSLNAVTEFAFSGKTTNGFAWDNKARGTWDGAISGLPLFSSEAKYESGTGWPSFWAPIDPGHVIERLDPADIERGVPRGMVRVEVLDRVSGAHLGHVFGDGPPEHGGKRYCMNAAALTFRPAKK